MIASRRFDSVALAHYGISNVLGTPFKLWLIIFNTFSNVSL